MKKNIGKYETGNKTVQYEGGVIKISTKNKIGNKSVNPYGAGSISEQKPTSIDKIIKTEIISKTAPTPAQIKKKKIINIAICSILIVGIALSIIIPVAYKNRVRQSELKLQSPVIESGKVVLTWDKVDGAYYYIVNITEKTFEEAIQKNSFQINALIINSASTNSFAQEKKVYTNSYEPDELYPGNYVATITAYSNSDKIIKTNAKELSFDIPKCKLTVEAISTAIVSKTYDKTTAFDSILIKNREYKINGARYGENVDISIGSKTLNSSDVEACNTLSVEFTAELTGEASKHYYIEKGSINIAARILPKEIAVTPELIEKEFGGSDDLSFEVEDSVTEETISFTLLRQSGETIGNYDITGARSLNSNYSIKIASGKNKFIITKRVLTITAETEFAEKDYNGTKELTISETAKIQKDKHYKIENELSGYEVDIEIESATLNSRNVSDCTTAEIKIYGLKGSFVDIYSITVDSFELPAKILPKKIDIIPSAFSKQFGDSDSLISSYVDDILSTTVPLQFSRILGEEIGTYDIAGVESANRNYNPVLIANSGKNKFSIVKRVIQIVPKDIEISKTYDGTDDFSGQMLIGEHYDIINILDGFLTDINILTAKFNSKNVNDASRLKLEYSAVLSGDDEIHTVLNSSIEFAAKILPKTVEIEPNKITKEYREPDDLSYGYFDEDFLQLVNIKFTRNSGEAIRTYNLTGIENENKNYDFILKNGGNKFEIVKRKLIVKAIEGEKVSKIFDNTSFATHLLIRDRHYLIENVLIDKPVEIIFDAGFNIFSTIASKVTLKINSISNSEYYELITDEIEIPAEILPKEIHITPDKIIKQYGDEDYLTVIFHDALLNLNISIYFERAKGEAIGKYSLISVSSFNINYHFDFNTADGLDRFEIVQRVVNVERILDITLSKTYDGTDSFASDILEGTHYTLSNLKGGDSPDIELVILSKTFDFPDVSKARKVTVVYSMYFSGTDSNKYITTGGVLEYYAYISPKEIKVSPTSYTKEFGNSESLTDTYKDETLNTTINLSFHRTLGENIDTYDIIAVSCDNPNYLAVMAVDSGTAKFTITKRIVSVSEVEQTISKVYDGNTGYNIDITESRHYTFSNTLSDYFVDIDILSVYFNSANVTAAETLTVAFASLLIDPNGVYVLDSNSNLQLIFNAEITAKQISVTPKLYEYIYGEAENLIATYTDTTLSTNINLTFSRNLGTLPNSYDIISATGSNNNYSFVVANGEGKVQIQKRKITVSVVAGIPKFTKQFDNTVAFLDFTQKDTHYVINNTVLGEDTDINFSAEFNSKNVFACDSVLMTITSLTKYSDRYELATVKTTFPAIITPKAINITPKYFSKQYGDPDDLTQEITDSDTMIKMTATFIRSGTENPGVYDFVGASCSDKNFVILFNDGIGRLIIVSRILTITNTQSSPIAKTYDGTDLCPIPISQGVHYMLNNVNGGTSASLTILSVRFDSSEVSLAAKVIVTYSAEVETSIPGSHTITGGTIEFEAKINPKPINIIPQDFNYIFGDTENLVQTYSDTVLGIDVPISFVRSSGVLPNKYNITACATANINYSPILVTNSGNNKVTISKRLISLTADNDIVLEKAYDGSNQYTDALILGTHYYLANTIVGYDVDITVLNVTYNNKSTASALSVTAVFSPVLIDVNGAYEISTTSFVLNAKITQRIVEITPPSFQKQYGDNDNLTYTHYDNGTDENIPVLFSRAVGESVASYDILTCTSADTNYLFTVTNGTHKMEIKKRIISVSPLSVAPFTKVFDSNNSFGGSLLRGTHYTVNNEVSGNPAGISYIAYFEDSTTACATLTVEIAILSQYADRYTLSNNIFTLPAKITPKNISVFPEYFYKQYGASDYIVRNVTDYQTGITFSVTYSRTAGENVGIYDIVSGTSANSNYTVTITSGTGLFIITPIVLQVEKVVNAKLTKIYDGTDNCDTVLMQGIHYILTNLNGGTGNDVSLTIVSKKFNSPNVLTANKVTVSYTATVSGVNGANSAITGGTLIFDAEILPRPYAVRVNQFSKIYGDSEDLSQIVEVPMPNGTIETHRVNFARQAGENAGIYNITGVSSLDTNNDYSIFTGTPGNGIGKMVIVKRDMAITASNRNTIYNAAPQTLASITIIPSLDEVTNATITYTVEYKLSSENDSAYTITAPTNAGNYIVRISYPGDSNHNPLTITRNLIIERANAIITITSPNQFTYDGNIKLITATLNHSETTVQFSRNDHINAGTYNNILVSSAQTLNYKATSILTSISILKKVMYNSDISFPSASAITYEDYLALSVLSFTKNALGEFEWQTPYVLPKVNNNGFALKFAPFDTLNYDWLNVDFLKTVAVMVNKKIIANIDFPTATSINNGQTLYESKLNGESVYGTFAWEIPQSKPGNRENYYYVVFTPFDTENYDFSLIVMKQPTKIEVCFTINFVTNGGVTLNDLLVLELTAPPKTSKTGFDFEGWYLDSGFTTKMTYPYAVNFNTTLYALWKTSGLIFELNKSGTGYIVSRDYNNPVKSITIPNEYKSLPIVEIKESAFENDGYLEYIYISETVKLISNRAFFNCYNLFSIEIYNSQSNLDFGGNWNKTNTLTDIYFYF